MNQHDSEEVHRDTVLGGSHTSMDLSSRKPTRFLHEDLSMFPCRLMGGWRLGRKKNCELCPEPSSIAKFALGERTLSQHYWSLGKRIPPTGAVSKLSVSTKEKHEQQGSGI